MLTGNVLITGGAGFLGRGIMRRARKENWSARFTVLSRDEKKQVECRANYPEARYVLGDVTDLSRLALTMVGHDTVIHAAALKYIPEGEFNADECVRVNIDGARCVIDAARSVGIDRVVGISTDKAAQPVNIYGMTKAVMERLFGEAGFTTCRYGNVIGSTGSVVPVMQAQFRRDGFVQITDPLMTRFWMSVDDAVDTIIQALNAEPGTVTVPEPKAAFMQSVAYAVLMSLGEQVPDTIHEDGALLADSRIHVVGVRPGEKMHEDLVSEHEMHRTTYVSPYYTIHGPGFTPNPDWLGTTRTGLSSRWGGTIERKQFAELIDDAVTV